MNFEDYFPIYHKLTASQKQLIKQTIQEYHIKKGTLISQGKLDCTGLLLVADGVLRAYIQSDEGKEMTLYRLYDHDLCLFSASCIMNSLQFDVMIEADEDSRCFLIPVDIYKQLMSENVVVANYTNELMASRFTDVVWLIEKILWQSLDARLAEYLLERTSPIKITHEKIASDLGHPREVITRMLKYFSQEGYIKTSRGTIEIIDEAALERLVN